MLPDREELQACVRDHNMYTCEKNLPIYYSEAEAPCEVLAYMKAPGQVRNCEKGQILSETTLWITLTEEQSWLYSTPNPQEVTIQCENESENKIVLDRTGKLSINKKYIITTSHVTLRTQKAIITKQIQAYIPMFNLSLNYKSDGGIKTAKKLKQVIKNPLELTKLSSSLEEIRHSIENQESSIFRNKYFMYPVGSGTLIIIIVSIIAIVTWKIKKIKTKRRTKEVNTEIERRREDAMMY